MAIRWLLAKDLLILRRSPALVALLVIYPIVISVLIGFALSRGPDKPEVAFVNLVPEERNEITLGNENIDISQYSRQLFDAIDPVRVDSEREALQKVRDGDVIAALVIPADVTERLQQMQSLVATEPPEVKVFFNSDDPVKASYVEDTIKSQVNDANVALTEKFTEVALSYLDLIVEGGEVDLPLFEDIEILGLERSQELIEEAEKTAPAASRADLREVARFAQLARENLDLSDEILNSVGSPLKVRQIALDGGATPLSSFAVALAVAVSLMFITLLLAAAALALEREENAYARLVRGLVSRTGLLAEKAGLAAACSLAICLVMLVGLGLFVDLRWERFGHWALATAAGGLAFAALGVAVGALTREVRTASLLCVMVSLPLTFLALVPSGAVSPALYDVIRAISAAFPFDPALDALDAALNGGSLGGDLAHLAALFAGFGAIARISLRRFA